MAALGLEVNVRVLAKAGGAAMAARRADLCRHLRRQLFPYPSIALAKSSRTLARRTLWHNVGMLTYSQTSGEMRNGVRRPARNRLCRPRRGREQSRHAGDSQYRPVAAGNLHHQPPGKHHHPRPLRDVAHAQPSEPDVRPFRLRHPRRRDRESRQTARLDRMHRDEQRSSGSDLDRRASRRPAIG